MKLWQVRQKHHDDLQALTKELGFADSQGRIRKFNGSLFWPRWEALGHSRASWDECKCQGESRGRPYDPNQEV